MSALETTVLPAALALAWELSLTLVGVQLAQILGLVPNRGEDPPELFVLTVLAGNIFVSAGLASVFSFLKVNSFATYFGAMLVMLTASVYGLRRRPIRPADLGGLFERSAASRSPWAFGTLCCIFVPAFLPALRPIIEVDSLHALNFMLDWLSNRTTPYVFFYDYVAFWELAYLPLLALTRSDAFFWMVSLKPVLITALGLYALGLTLRMPSRLALITAAASMGFVYFWWGPSGIPTLKNDMLYAAGFVLIALAVTNCAQGRIDRVQLFLLTCGLAFITVKYSGLAIAAVGLIAFVLLSYERLRFGRTGLLWSGIGLACVLASTGHYYLKNLVVYHNAFYPVRIRLLGVTFPGTRELTGTSILSTLDDNRLWRLFFLPEGLLSPAGALFPITLAATLLVSLLLVLGSLYRIARGTAWSRPHLALAILLLSGWMSYFGSYWSASEVPGDLFYVLRDLASLRYVGGVLGVSEVFLVALLYEMGLSEPLLIALAAVNLASRGFILSLKWPWTTVFTFYHATALGMACGVIIFIGRVLPRPAGYISVIGLLLLFPLMAGPLIVERNREAWAPWWASAVMPLRDAPSTTIFMLAEPGGSYGHHRYLMAGRRFQHSVRVGSEAELVSLATRPDDPPKFVVALRNPNVPPQPDLLSDVAAKLVPYGYETLAVGGYALFLQRVSAASEVVDGTVSSTTWFVDDKPLIPGEPADTGNLRPAARMLARGDRVLSGTPLKLYRLEEGGAVLVNVAEGAAVTIANGGPPDTTGVPHGLTYRFRSGKWAPDLSDLERANPDHDFRVARGMNSLGPWQISTSAAEGYRLEHLADESGAFVRVTATKTARWLVILGRFPKDFVDGMPVTVRAEARCHGTSRYALDLFDFLPSRRYVHVQRIGGACGDWQTLVVWRRVEFWSKQDYYALGLIEPKEGDSFDVRELSLLKGFAPQ